jgi:hypothetical protein
MFACAARSRLTFSICRSIRASRLASFDKKHISFEKSTSRMTDSITILSVIAKCLLMTLCIAWTQAVRFLLPACRRSHTFLWIVLALMGLCCRLDLAGVTSYVRVLGVRPKAYRRFLYLFHIWGNRSGKAHRLLGPPLPHTDSAPARWLPHGLPRRLHKEPQRGQANARRQDAAPEIGSNSKPEYIMGHSFQAISLLFQGSSGHVAAVLLTSRIHEGLALSKRDSRTLLDKLAALLFSIASVLSRKIQLAADAY